MMLLHTVLVWRGQSIGIAERGREAEKKRPLETENERLQSANRKCANREHPKRNPEP